MSATDFGEWQPMTSAPKDGTKVLVAIRASEQGAAEVDVARWARAKAGGNCWISADSDPGAEIVYSDAELAFWMPMPAPLPKRGARKGASQWPKPPEADEMGGSGI